MNLTAAGIGQQCLEASPSQACVCAWCSYDTPQLGTITSFYSGKPPSPSANFNLTFSETKKLFEACVCSIEGANLLWAHKYTYINSIAFTTIYNRLMIGAETLSIFHALRVHENEN